MVEFVVGIILKDRMVFSPNGIKTYSDLLKDVGIECNQHFINANETFVKIYSTPKNTNKISDVNEWIYSIEQYVVPNWYKENSKKYEQEFRNKVQEFISNNYTIIYGKEWTPIIKTTDYTYYLLNGILEWSKFGRNNNYSSSYIREELNNGELVKELKNKFGDRLIPTCTDLVSYREKSHDYGSVEGDILAIPSLKFYEEYRKKIPLLIYKDWWLATPWSCRIMFNKFNRDVRDDKEVLYVGSYGSTYYEQCSMPLGVRPYFILKS